MTTTERESFTLPNDSLTLVTVSEEYRTAGAWHTFRTLTTDDERTFYALPHPRNPGEYVNLIVPDTDPRHEGMRNPDALERERVERAGMTVPYRIWSVESRYVTPVAPRPLEEGDRVRVSDSHPAVDWRGLTGRIRQVRPDSSVPYTVQVDDDAPRLAGVRVGFEEGYLTRYTPQSDSEAPQSDAEVVPAAEVQRLIDEAVREAVHTERQEGQAALQRFKETANRIAVQYAEDNELCGNFESAMADIGLLGREEFHDQHDPEFRVTMSVTYTVRDRDEYDARDKAYSELYDVLPGGPDGTINVLSVEQVED